VAPLPPENPYGHTKKLRFLLDEIARHRAVLGRPVTLLDFGCGNGSAVSQYLIGSGTRYYGVDIHGPSLAYARAKFGGPDAQFMDRIPENIRFDIIAYADVLEHVRDPSALLKKHLAHLAPDGVMICAVPNGFGPFEIEQRLDRRLGLSQMLSALSAAKRRLQGSAPAAQAEALPYNHESGHVVFFTRRSLRQAVADAGLEIIRFAHGALMGASISGIAIARFPGLLRLNVRVADRLPYWAVSTWYVTLRRRTQP
jgi:SAM-dependent methyltransferase